MSSPRRREILFEGMPSPLGAAIVRSERDLDLARADALVRAGAVFLDGKRCRDPAKQVATGARIVVHAATEERVDAPPLRVLYEDDRIIVIDKPPGEHVNETETSAIISVVERLRDKNAFTVHRIDRETSGVVLLAKDRVTAEALSAEFRERRVHKTYLAIIRGRIDDGVIRERIGRDPRRPRARWVTAGGKPAETRISSLSHAGEVSAIEAEPVTGRTHQIRVHLAHRGVPIVGDLLYGGVRAVRLGERVLTADRVMLHALSLAITLAGGERTFRAPIPEDMLCFQDAGLPLGRVIA